MDHKLSVKAQKGTMTPELQRLIKDNKDEIVELIESMMQTAEIEAAPVRDSYALSSAQQRQYFLYAFDKGSVAYNMPQVVKLQGSLDRAHLERVFGQLISRH